MNGNRSKKYSLEGEGLPSPFLTYWDIKTQWDESVLGDWLDVVEARLEELGGVRLREGVIHEARTALSDQTIFARIYYQMVRTDITMKLKVVRNEYG